MALVIATMIITAGYVGYHAWQESLHEEPEAHSEHIVIQNTHPEFKQIIFHEKFVLNISII